jgi:Ca2+:H+ antiporter
MTSGGRSAWFIGVLLLTVYLIFAMTLYLMPPRLQGEATGARKTTENSAHGTYDHRSGDRLFVHSGTVRA